MTDYTPSDEAKKAGTECFLYLRERSAKPDYGIEPEEFVEDILTAAVPLELQREREERWEAELRSEEFVRTIASALIQPSSVKAAYHHNEPVKYGKRLEEALRDAIVVALAAALPTEEERNG